MKLDKDGLDGILYSPSPARKKTPPRPVLSKSVAKPVAKPKTQRVEKRVEPSRPAGIFYPGSESTRNEPLELPLASKPITPLPVAAPPPTETGGEEYPYNKTQSRKWRISAIVVAIGALVALTAAFFSGEFQTNFKADTGQTSATDILKTKETFSENKKQNELEKTVELKEKQRQIEQGIADAKILPIETVRFSGTYRRGEIFPDDTQKREVDRIFERMLTCKDTIIITGHACSLGNDDTNDDISAKRAKVVSKYFLKHGFDKHRLVVKGMGSSDPIADNNTKQGRIQNRRVDISCH